MGIQQHDAVRSIGHFTMQKQTASGELVGSIIKCSTQAGVIMNSPIATDEAHIIRMCELARDNPNYPYDISCFKGPTGARELVCTWRLFWRD